MRASTLSGEEDACMWVGIICVTFRWEEQKFGMNVAVGLSCGPSVVENRVLCQA